jgi:hypothetical protein
VPGEQQRDEVVAQLGVAKTVLGGHGEQPGQDVGAAAPVRVSPLGDLRVEQAVQLRLDGGQLPPRPEPLQRRVDPSGHDDRTDRDHPPDRRAQRGEPPHVPEQRDGTREDADRARELARRVLAGERRALSVRRPWANLIIGGHKTVENRTWVTDHRGELVIHAGQAWDPVGALRAAELGIADIDDRHGCPGGYLGRVRLVDVHPAGGCCAPWGEQAPGIYHWVLTDAAPFTSPVPGQGRLGLYWIPADLLADAL